MTVLKKLKAFVPTLEDTVGTLSQPPTLPATAAIPAPSVASASPAEKRAGQGPRTRRSSLPSDRLHIKSGGTDGRSLRRTGRTALLSLKVHPDLPEAMKQAAFEDGITLGALMDEMWAAFEQRRKRARADV